MGPSFGDCYPPFLMRFARCLLSLVISVGSIPRIDSDANALTSFSSSQLESALQAPAYMAVGYSLDLNLSKTHFKSAFPTLKSYLSDLEPSNWKVGALLIALTVAITWLQTKGKKNINSLSASVLTEEIKKIYGRSFPSVYTSRDFRALQGLLGGLKKKFHSIIELRRILEKSRLMVSPEIMQRLRELLFVAPDTDFAQNWEPGSLTAAGESYGDEIPAIWIAEFIQWACDRSWLDVGTGGFFLPALAHDSGIRDEKRIRVIATDIVPAPDIPGYVEFRLLNKERFPVPDSSVSYVTSNFGAEYGDLTKAINETWRVLEPGGRAAYFMHHPVSRFTLNGMYLLALYELALLLTEDVILFTPGKPDANLRPRYLEIAALAEEFDHPIIDYVVSRSEDLVLRFENRDYENLVSDAEEFLKILGGAMSRNETLLTIGVNETTMGILTNLVFQKGFISTNVELHVDREGLILGWMLQFQKPGTLPPSAVLAAA